MPDEEGELLRAGELGLIPILGKFLDKFLLQVYFVRNVGSFWAAVIPCSRPIIPGYQQATGQMVRASYAVTDANPWPGSLIDRGVVCTVSVPPQQIYRVWLLT